MDNDTPPLPHHGRTPSGSIPEEDILGARDISQGEMGVETCSGSSGSSTPPPPSTSTLSHDDGKSHCIVSGLGNTDKKHVKIAPTTAFAKILRAFNARGSLKLKSTGQLLSITDTPESIGAATGWVGRIGLELVPPAEGESGEQQQQQQDDALASTAAPTALDPGQFEVQSDGPVLQTSASAFYESPSHQPEFGLVKESSISPSALPSNTAVEKVLLNVTMGKSKKTVWMPSHLSFMWLLNAFQVEDSAYIVLVPNKADKKEDELIAVKATPAELGLEGGETAPIDIEIMETEKPKPRDDRVSLTISNASGSAAQQQQQYKCQLAMHSHFKYAMTALNLKGTLQGVDPELTPALKGMKPGETMQLQFAPAEDDNSGEVQAVMVVEGVVFERIAPVDEGSSSCSCCVLQ